MITRHVQTWGPAALALFLVSLGFFGMERAGRGGSESVRPPIAARTVSAPAISSRSTAVRRPEDVLPAGMKARPVVTPDSLPSEGDLYQVFAAHIDSADPRLRRAAARAFEACVPAFLPAHGEETSPQALIRALPAGHDPDREAAYWVLYTRCGQLLALGREPLLNLLRTLQSDRALREPGQRAQEALALGDVVGAGQIVGGVLAESDPAAVASLAGLASRLASRKAAEGDDRQRGRRAAAVDAALPLVACDLGQDCSAGSVRALQLCAVQDLCYGTAKDRLVEQARRDGVDRAELDAQRRRLLALIGSRHTLGLDDLLD